MQLDAAPLIALCDGRTCGGIAAALGVRFEIVRRHLRRLTNLRLINERLHGRRYVYWKA
jgi:predicted transcriptional regulator